MTAPAPPQFLLPTGTDPLPIAPLLSNKRGSNTGADAIAFKVRYTNPRASGDPASAIRAITKRTMVGGRPQTPGTTWDSGWVGGATVNALPVAVSAHQAVYANGRIYVIGGQDASSNLRSEVWSATFNNGAIGTWRQETDYPFPVAGHAATAVAMSSAEPNNYNFIYSIGGAIALNPLAPGFCTITANGWYAPINSDGSLGAWTAIQVPLSVSSVGDNPSMFGQLCQIGWNTNAGAPYYGLPIIAYSGGTATNSAASGSGVFASTGPLATFMTATLNADGSMWATFWQKNGNLTNAVFGHFMYYDTFNDVIIALGGSNGTAAQTWGQWVAWNTNAPQGALTWANNTTALPAVRCGMDGIYSPTWDNTFKGRIILIGGTSAANMPTQTTVIATGIFAASGTALTSGSWTAFTNSLATGVDAAQAVGVMEGRAGTIAGVHQIAVLGGFTALNAPSSIVVTASATPPVASANYGTWRSGSGAALAAGSLGTGGAVTSNQDGSIDFTFNYGGFGQAMVSSFADGDQVQIPDQFLDQQGGDPSPIAYAVLRIGQPPTISGVSPASGATPSNGRPDCMFLFSSGAGGGPEYAWQIQVKQASTVVFDSGVQRNSLNQVSPLPVGPLLDPSIAYTLVVNVWAADTAYPGSSITATSSTTFTTTAFVLPSAPTGFTAADNAAGGMALSWGSVAGCTYRIYNRRHGVSAWSLLADAVATTSYLAMDETALGGSYDYAVAAVNATPAESALSTAQSSKVVLPGRSSGWLHIAGQGATFAAPVFVEDATAVKEELDTVALMPFGGRAPISRSGSADYHRLTLAPWLHDLFAATTLAAYQAVMDQVKAGAICIYRSSTGGMLTCALDGEQQITVQPWIAGTGRRVRRDLSMPLVEVANTLGAYVAAGVTARGYRALVGGSKPPLDPSERIL